MDGTVRAPALTAKQWRMYRGAFWLFLVAETIVFITLFSTRFLLASGDRSPALNYPLGGALTILLGGSVLSARRAVRAAARGDSGALAGSLGLTFLLGLAVLSGLVYDWSTVRVSPTSSLGENYFLSTGYHALHLVIGLVALLALWSASRKGRYGPWNYWAVEAGALFWLFVVVMWVGVYLVFFWL